jgi:2-C-methyl-D-erythritol 4-phosphate cytidylyltransferase
MDAILLAAGRSTRMGGSVPKQLVLIAGRPLVLYSLDVLLAHPAVGTIVLTHPPGEKTALAAALPPGVGERLVMVEGGETRQESVRRALEAVTTQRVLLHETARPLITAALIDRVVAVDAPAVVPTHAIPFSVSIGGDVMEAEIDRSTLHDVQLPQAFDTAILRAAHERARQRGESVTEDGVLVFRLGHEVRFVTGLPRNLKVTYPVDLTLVESVLRLESDSNG